MSPAPACVHISNTESAESQEKQIVAIFDIDGGLPRNALWVMEENASFRNKFPVQIELYFIKTIKCDQWSTDLHKQAVCPSNVAVVVDDSFQSLTNGVTIKAFDPKVLSAQDFALKSA